MIMEQKDVLMIIFGVVIILLFIAVLIFLVAEYIAENKETTKDKSETQKIWDFIAKQQEIKSKNNVALYEYLATLDKRLAKLERKENKK